MRDIQVATPLRISRHGVPLPLKFLLC